MTRRTPFQLRVWRPLDRRKGIDGDFRDLVLEQLQRTRVAEFRVTSQRMSGVLARAEAVHQKQADARAKTLSQVQELVDNDVQESQIISYPEQALRFLEAHARAEPAIEFYDRRLGQVLLRGAQL